MNKLTYSLKRLVREKRNTLLFVIMSFVLSSSVIFSSIILNACDLYKSKRINPYSDYYRLMCDEMAGAKFVGEHDESLISLVENYGYTDKDLMFSNMSNMIEMINGYFLDITDYYVEMLCTSYSKKLDPVIPEWWEGSSKFLLHAVPDARALTVFLRGESVLTHGRYIDSNDSENENYVCMISDSLAEKNGIKVGDTVNFSISSEPSAENKYFDFEVVGIYHDYKAQRPDITEVIGSDEIKEQRVYIPLSLIEGKINAKCYNYQIKLSDNSLVYEIEELINRYHLGRGKAYLIKVEDIFNSNNQEVSVLQTTFTVIQYSVIVFSALFTILYLYSMITARKRECGVLLGLGKTKREVFVSIFFEYGTCIIIALLLSLVLSASLGDEFAAMIYNFVGQNNSAEAVTLTTSDAVLRIVNEEKSVEKMLDTSFISNCIFLGIVLLIPVFTLGFISAAVVIFRINVMKLLTKEEG